MQPTKFLCILLVALLTAVSCSRPEADFDNTPAGNVESLWHIIDTRYCYLDEKGVDWDSVRTAAHARLPEVGDDPVRLFDLMSEMLAALRDGHVNLYSPFDVSRYDRWYTDSATNYNASVIRRRYLDDTVRVAGGLTYARLRGENIGYVAYSSFSTGFTDANMRAVVSAFSGCSALILDVRGNGGGSLARSEQLASYFFPERRLTGYMRHKTGAGHTDLSDPTPVYTPSHPTVRWKRPVAVLTHRYSYSATNDFVCRMAHAPQAITVGTWTGGGGGMPLSSELPNGWMVRFSASPMYTADMQHTEFGLAPMHYVCTTPEEEASGTDAVIERAVRELMLH